MSGRIDVLVVLDSISWNDTPFDMGGKIERVRGAVSELLAAVADGHEVPSRHGHVWVFNEEQSVRLSKALWNAGGAE